MLTLKNNIIYSFLPLPDLVLGGDLNAKHPDWYTPHDTTARGVEIFIFWWWRSFPFIFNNTLIPLTYHIKPYIDLPPQTSPSALHHSHSGFRGDWKRTSHPTNCPI
jgi:hypothetical protein